MGEGLGTRLKLFIVTLDKPGQSKDQDQAVFFCFKVLHKLFLRDSPSLCIC